MAKHKKVVVFVHGILESPMQFSDMGNAIADICDTVFLLLPGHGKTGKDFGESSMKQWKSYFSNEIEKLRENYDEIYIVAHSMGCLLSVLETLKNPSKISGLFLIANPLVISVNNQGFKNAFRVAYNMAYKKEETCEFIGKVYSVSDCRLTDYPMWIPRYRELIKESKKVRNLMKKLTVPTFNIFSMHDEFVSLDSADYLAGVKNYKLVILEKSGHFYYTQDERTKIIDELTGFIG